MRTPHLVFLGLAACQPTEILVTGTVFRGSDGLERAPDATVSTYGAEGARYDQAVTDANGDFTARALRAQNLFAVVSAEGAVTTSFTGVAGMVDLAVPPYLERNLDARTTEQVLVDGSLVPSLYTFATADMDAWRARFAGCPGADGAEGAILGKVRYFLFDSESVGGDFQPPLVQRPELVAVSDATGDRVTACYLDAAGESWDSGATNAGEAQVFAIFGLSEGRYTLDVRHGVTDTLYSEAFYSVFVPQGGVATRFPLWIEFPMF